MRLDHLFRKLLHLLQLNLGQVFLFVLGVRFEKQQGHLHVVIEVDHPRSTSLAAPFQLPAQLADPSASGYNRTRCWVECHVLDKFRPLLIVHQLARRSEELVRFNDRDGLKLCQDSL